MNKTATVAQQSGSLVGIRIILRVVTCLLIAIGGFVIPFILSSGQEVEAEKQVIAQKMEADPAVQSVVSNAPQQSKNLPKEQENPDAAVAVTEATVDEQSKPAEPQQPEKIQAPQGLQLVNPFTGATIAISEAEFEMACEVVEAEGESTGFENKEEIAEVIRNRMFNAGYRASSLVALFRAPGQFETVDSEGNVRRSGRYFTFERVPEETKQAVRMAFAGQANLPANALGWRGNGSRNIIVYE